MKRAFSLIVLGALSLTSAAAVAPGSSAPDTGQQYHERINCHLAYDLLFEDIDAGRAISNDYREWARSHEKEAGASGKCPAPPEELAKRASNRVIATKDGFAVAYSYSKLKDPAALLETGFSVLQGKMPGIDKAVGIEPVLEAAKLGEPHAQYFVASLHSAGSFGKAQDYASALPLMEAAAKSGHLDAIFQTANFYHAGLGTKADPKRAFPLYQEAASRGHIYAAIVAFDMINEGKGTKKDFNLAYRLGRNLADRGQVYGAVMAAGALLQQKNVKSHENEVLYWMDVAMRDGDESIRTKIGPLRQQVVSAYARAKAPPEYRPRVRKLCPLKRTCIVNHYSGLQSCTTNVDYWNDCDG
ncbi:MAG TPA: tetratricopeptide repeat protein [Allosphingosinicella sp.]|jgi:hypothetical protein